MVVKLIFADKSTKIHRFSDDELGVLVRDSDIKSYLSDLVGEEVEYWQTSYRNSSTVEVDFRDIVIEYGKNKPNKIDNKEVEDWEFLEEDSYEYLLSYLEDEDSSYIKIIDYHVREEDCDYDPSDYYSDDPN